jgi:4-hydroxy-tetrahydrodipicolinate synthase
VGADAALLVTPYYNRPTQRGLYEHFRAIAAAVEIPQILYNVPGRTCVDMSNETVARLAGLDNIVGIKDATGDVQRGRELIALCGQQIAVYSGDDPTAMELMLAGGRGNISVTANVAPVQMAELCRLALAGERVAAEELNTRLAPLNEALFLEANPIPVKWALYRRGLIEEGIRLPLTPLDQKYRSQVLAALEALGV